MPLYHSAALVVLNQISMREMEHVKKYPNAKLIRLGIGDTTQPIPHAISSVMSEVSISILIN